ncbi:ATP-binding protein [Paractinoplanes lichenicola]|uniref:Tetratricopeptide repeat protein n=1 Tax=Paractinoplanes lichenicola TaxID=2802976 RepID=A0ABS1VH93_9ACTN|nr:tetratricopeptide repeat protein [Actinoplanes lichenicola]MBL7253122.1 tetratricopeptide repeat protein [Actinoplanes lichenicola]
MSVEVRVLGTVGLGHDGEWHAPPSGLLRALLAALAVSTEEVSAAALIETVWEGSAREATVAVAVHRLRRWLAETVGEAARVTRPTSGYLLEMPNGGTDVRRFRAHVTAARGPELGDRERAGLLTEALAVWRGPALDDVPPKFTLDAVVSQLEGERLTATTELGRTLLRLGEPGRAVELLTAAARRHPLDELVQGLLVEALDRAGRQAEALRTYRTVRDRLVDELGVEPGPELHGAYLQVLRQDPAATPVPSPEPPVPAQLPADVAHFMGREDALRAMDLHSGRHGGPPAGISVVTGTAGVGKTALARRWAHRSRARFPDGQLFVDLRGYSDGAPADPLDVLGTLLRALGLPADRVPAALEEAAAAYRTRLADRRMLVVLDNARSADQVRPLLPGSASCHVVVTSRDSLAGLVAVEGARPVTLGPLTAAQAGRLLAGLLGEDTVRAEPEAARRLAEICAYLPLALRIVCARPSASLAERVAALDGGDRLAALELPGDERAGVAAAIRHSYDALPPAARRLFRLLGTARVHDFTEAAFPGLGTLAAAGLLEERRPGRFALHDLLRDYAARLPEPERDAERARLLDWYLTRARAATRLLYPHIWQMAPADPASDREEALRWLDDERANLVAVAGTGPHAWLLADALRGYLWHGDHHTEWRALTQAGLAAAERHGDQFAQAVMARGLAQLATERRAPDAIEQQLRALELCRRCGWREGEAQTLGGLGRSYSEIGRPAVAVSYLEQALEITEAIGAVAGTAATLGNLGIVVVELGQLARAAELHGRALQLFRAMDARPAVANALNNLATALWSLGRADEARTLLEEALTLTREAGDGGSEAYALGVLARIETDPDRALRHARDALVLVQVAGDERQQAEMLCELGALHLEQHDTRTALDCFRRAAAHAEHATSPLPGLRALVGMAAAEHRLGNTTEADSLVRRALTGCQEHGYRIVEGEAWTVRAELDLARNRPAEARAAEEQALEVWRETGHRPAAGVTRPVS